MLEIIQTERADLAQYIPFVIVGVLAYRRGLLQTLPVRVGYACFAAATALSLVYVTFRTEFTGFFEWSSANIGQFTWSSYETVLCVGFALGLFVFFRDHVRGTSQLQRSAVQLVRSCWYGCTHVPWRAIRIARGQIVSREVS
ncbi:hypothetical protein [Brevibacterium aurantiacum]|uniref:hypothetical protein n=2 Tax=Brevibacterium aurantiacum TaxID=273384 RepID=UPI001868972A|nr:hypothetical protein [Brevibacterium aurantiacum]